MSSDRLIPSDSTPSVVTSIIRIDGDDIPETHQVLSIVIERDLNRIPFAKIHLKDGDPAIEDFPLSNDALYEPGKEIEIFVGYEAQEELLFKGVVVKHGLKIRQDGTSLLLLDCRDKAYKTTLMPKNRYFTEVSDAEAIEEILSEYDVNIESSSSDITHQEIVQFESTDWDFITTRAKSIGQICLLSDGSFKMMVPDFEQEPILTLTYGATILEFDAEIDSRKQFGKVSANSWNYTTQELLDVEASEPTIPETGNLTSGTLADVGGSLTLNLKHNGHVVEDELQAWADSELLRMRMSKIRGRIKFQGYSSIKPAQLVLLAGVGERFNGEVFVSSVRHEIHGGTWHTDVQFGLHEEWISPTNHKVPKFAQGLVSGVPGLQIGIVSQLQDDPDGENRILVKVPTIGKEEEGIWSRVAMSDAGDGRGVFFLPDIGDEVVIGFLQGDPRDPIVLGMLNSSAKPAPIEVSDDNFIKGVVTNSELKLLFDDEKNILQLETPAGKKILLDEDQGAIQLEDENNNKIILDSNGVTVESSGDLILKAGTAVKVESGSDIEMSAGASFKATGSAGAEVTTSAIAKLEGSLVQIN